MSITVKSKEFPKTNPSIPFPKLMRDLNGAKIMLMEKPEAGVVLKIAAGFTSFSLGEYFDDFIPYGLTDYFGSVTLSQSLPEPENLKLMQHVSDEHYFCVVNSHGKAEVVRTKELGFNQLDGEEFDIYEGAWKDTGVRIPSTDSEPLDDEWPKLMIRPSKNLFQTDLLTIFTSKREGTNIGVSKINDVGMSSLGHHFCAPSDLHEDEFNPLVGDYTITQTAEGIDAYFSAEQF